MKKYILGLLLAVTMPMFAYAATPTLTVSGADDGNNVTVRVTGGEINAPVELFYNRPVGQLPQRTAIGTTDMNGSFTGTISTRGLGITQVSPVYVQVGGYQSLPVNWPFNAIGSTATSTGAIMFSNVSPAISIGQNGMVTISGGEGGTYYIASNSNPNFTSAAISGNMLTLSGMQAGQSSITVCSTAGPCAVVTPNFSFSGSTSTSTTGVAGSPTLSASSVNIGQGGQGFVTLSGGMTPYTVSVVGGNNVSTTLIGNTLYINGNAAGTATVNVCSATTGTSGTLCTPVTVNVSGSSGQVAGTSTGMLTFSLPLTSGEALRLSLSGGSGSYYVQPMGSSLVNANVSGNMLTLTGMGTGSATINVCSGSSSASTTCLPIAVTVIPASTGGTGGGYFFETNLSMGMSGQDVMELQNRLREEGFFNVASTGYFGPLTASAVRAYQAANGLPTVGIVGPQTRALLNQ
jgi:peptidoglycan hydrolase-like protein with peptidoglycan-binding domain